MKLKLLLLTLLTLALHSCNSDFLSETICGSVVMAESQSTMNPELTPPDSIIVDVTNYIPAVLAKENLFKSLYTECDGENYPKSAIRKIRDYQAIMDDEFVRQSEKFFNDLQLTEADLLGIFDNEDVLDEDGLKEIKVGILYICVTSRYYYDYIESFHSLRDQYYEGKSIVECLGEVAGVTTFVAVAGHLAYGTLSKSAAISLLRSIASIGGKTALRYLSGVGLILMAGELLWCLH